MAEIVDLSSLIRRDTTVDGTDGFVDPWHDRTEDDTDDQGAATPQETLTISPSEDGLIDFDAHSGGAAGRKRPGRPDPALDWSNQELADLYRVQRLLGQAGIAVDTDRGVTDEGDPWFVYLDSQGEVFVHLCRIGGDYILDSSVQDEVVRGRCFNTLIERFAGRAEAAVALRPDGKNVIDLKARGKIVLHPGAALAALIWSILLVTDDLTFLAPSEKPADEPDGPNAEGHDHVATGDAPTDAAENHFAGSPEAAFSELFLDEADAETFLASARAARDGVDRAAPADLRDAATAQMVSPASIGMTGLGLTALAAAYGINRQAAQDETETDVPGTDMTHADTVETASAASQTPASHEAGDALSKQAAAGRIFVEDADIDGLDGDTIAASEAAKGAAALADAAAEQAAQAAALAEADLARVTEALAAGPARVANDAKVAIGSTLDSADQVAAQDGAGRGDPAAESANPTRLVRLLESVGLDDLLAGLDDAVDSGRAALTLIGGRAVGTSDSLTHLLDVSLTSHRFGTDLMPVVYMLRDSSGGSAEFGAALGPGPAIGSGLEADPTVPILPPEPSLAFQQFTDDVRDFIDHLVLSSEVEIIALENQILLIDVRALEEAGAEAFARTWSLDEDRMISTIGVREDFEAFDLIA